MYPNGHRASVVRADQTMHDQLNQPLTALYAHICFPTRYTTASHVYKFRAIKAIGNNIRAMETSVMFALVLLTVVACGAVGVSAATYYEPRPLKGGGGGECISQEILAQVQRDIQEQIEIHESCQANADRLEEEIRQLQAGSSRSNPATSCLEIHQAQPNARSGLYWIQSPSESIPSQAFCDMQRSECGCGTTTSGGWLRVAYLNMTNPSHQCPSEWTEVTNPVRACTRSAPSSGCRSETFNTRGVSYTQICGRVRGYQFCTPGAFASFTNNPSLTINDAYVDGVSITHGSPREHVWTMAIAETDFPNISPGAVCPCTSEQTQVSSVEIPPFVGSDYFCEARFGGDRLSNCDLNTGMGLFAMDPLWDGQQCNHFSTCCEFNGPPWFCRQLQEPTSDSIEVRLCANRGSTDEDILVDLIEFYVR